LRGRSTIRVVRLEKMETRGYYSPIAASKSLCFHVLAAAQPLTKKKIFLSFLSAIIWRPQHAHVADEIFTKNTSDVYQKFLKRNGHNILYIHITLAAHPSAIRSTLWLAQA
jgi:hypothetical protein